MKKPWKWVAVIAAAALVLPLAASGQKSNKRPVNEISLQELELIQEKVERELARAGRMLEERLYGIEKRIPNLVEERLAALDDYKLEEAIREQLKHVENLNVEEIRHHAQAASKLARELAENIAGEQGRVFTYSSDSESGWLGVSIGEVTPEKAKELKLSAERGVLIDDLDADGPAAKAGIKKGDVITEFAGQRVEGTAQFRRFVRETPAGRAVAVTVWRDGKAQQLTVTVGDMGDVIRDRVRERIATVTPRQNWGGTFRFNMPDVQVYSSMARPMLGIRTEDLDGQLGAYFGAPDNEGVLITHVNAGSPAEKAGLKAGDVIIKVDGGRVRETGDLREQMSDAREKKSIPVTVIRKGAETTVNVEVEQPKPAERPRMTRRLSI